MTLKPTFCENIIDPSLWVIILGNVASIILAIIQNWDLGQILWIYWAQSVIIGIINVRRIRNLKDFSTIDIQVNGKAITNTNLVKQSVATLFAMHYGFFHFVYFIFLAVLYLPTDLSLENIIFSLLIIFGFFGAHGFSYRYNINRDFKHKKPNLGTIMLYPYLRIIPMHLTIIFGSLMISSISLIFFMLLKTCADGGMHIIEHYLFRKK